MAVTERASMTERILEAAGRLFYRKGIRAVGVDTIAAEAGISKRSLYDTFPSKDVLVAAYLRQRVRPMATAGHSPVEQVLMLFDDLHKRFTDGDFRGCPFVNAVTELAEDCAEVRGIARDYKEQRRDSIADLLRQAGAVDPEGLAGQVALLIEGAIASMLVWQNPDVALQARAATVVLLRAGGTAS